MILRTDTWLLLPDGRRYKGATDPDGITPEGLGIMAVSENEFQIGNFLNGKLHGRGFTLTHEAWTNIEPVWIRGSYEEVMATAEFDSCGRVVHVDNVGHYEDRSVCHEKWTTDKDGFWEHGKFVNPIGKGLLKSLPWKWAITEYSRVDYYGGKPCSPAVYDNKIINAKPDGSYSFNGQAYVTVYDEHSLLFCDRYGTVFRLAPDEEYHYDEMSGNSIGCRHSFKLCIGIPDWDSLLKECRFDEIVHTVFSPLAVIEEKGWMHFLRIFYVRENIFFLSAKSIQIIERAAAEGNKYAQFAFARIHIVSKPNDDSVRISLDYLEKAHNQGLPDATAALADAWQYGDMGIVDRSKYAELLNDALERDSEFAYVLHLRAILFGTGCEPVDASKALEITNRLIDKNCSNGTHYALWFFYRSIAQHMLGNTKDALNFLEWSTIWGIPAAWSEMILIKMETAPDDKEEINRLIDSGIRANDNTCRTIKAQEMIEEFEDSSKEKQTEDFVMEIIDELKECYRMGNKTAPEIIGDIYYYGFLNRPEDNQLAWEWYGKSARWENVSAYEKMFDMVHDHYIDVDLHTRHMLALNGARLGSRKLLNETVMAHTYGYLDEFSAEIEQYYDPIFDDEPDSSDGNPVSSDDDCDNTPDDDGRFDAWA